MDDPDERKIAEPIGAGNGWSVLPIQSVASAQPCLTLFVGHEIVTPEQTGRVWNCDNRGLGEIVYPDAN